MNPDVKDLWIKDLNNPEINQAQGVLQDAEGNFCCLGVLCEIAVRQGIIPKPRIKFVHPEEMVSIRGDENYYLYGVEGDGFSLPDAVCEWAGLDSSDPHIDMSEQDYEEIFGGDYKNWDEFVFSPSLAGMNDEGIPFAVIAKAIEKKL